MGANFEPLGLVFPESKGSSMLHTLLSCPGLDPELRRAMMV